MKVHREFVHDSEFMVSIVFNKCPEIELIEKSVLQKLPDDQKCIMITKKLIEQMCYDDVEFPTIEPGSDPETGGDNKPGSSDDSSDGDDSQGDNDKSSSGDNSQDDDDKSGSGDHKQSSDVNKIMKIMAQILH